MFSHRWTPLCQFTAINISRTHDNTYVASDGANCNTYQQLKAEPASEKNLILKRLIIDKMTPSQEYMQVMHSSCQ